MAHWPLSWPILSKNFVVSENLPKKKRRLADASISWFSSQIYRKVNIRNVLKIKIKPTFVVANHGLLLHQGTHFGTLLTHTYSINSFYK